MVLALCRIAPYQLRLRRWRLLRTESESSERIFGVRQRRARQLMGGLPTLQIGNALAIPRRALIERLGQMSDSTPSQVSRFPPALRPQTLAAARLS
jgi:hypothetical protein